MKSATGNQERGNRRFRLLLTALLY